MFAVEGPIDSLFLDNCIAVAGADFNKLPLDYTIIFDNERRNKELLKQIDKTIDRGYKVVLWPDNVKEKDINDMILSGKTKQEIKEAIPDYEEYIYKNNDTQYGLCIIFEFLLRYYNFKESKKDSLKWFILDIEQELNVAELKKIQLHYKKQTK